MQRGPIGHCCQLQINSWLGTCGLAAGKPASLQERGVVRQLDTRPWRHGVRLSLQSEVSGHALAQGQH